MSKLKDEWASYVYYTQTLTEQSRYLTLSIIAAIWVLNGENAIVNNSYLLLALFFAAMFLLFDFLQYFTASVIYRIWLRGEEKKLDVVNDDTEVLKSPTIDIPVFTLFIIKAIFFIISAGILLLYLLKLNLCNC